MCEVLNFDVCFLGMNNTGASGNMIVNTMAGMAGGGLVVSSTVNKGLTNTTTMMVPGQQPHLTGNHGVPQVHIS